MEGNNKVLASFFYKNIFRFDLILFNFNELAKFSFQSHYTHGSLILQENLMQFPLHLISHAMNYRFLVEVFHHFEGEINFRFHCNLSPLCEAFYFFLIHTLHENQFIITHLANFRSS